MTTHDLSHRQKIELRLAIIQKLLPEIRANIERRRAAAGPQHPGDVETKARWLGPTLRRP